MENLEKPEAVSKMQSPEEEIIQLLHRGEIHTVPYSQVRSFRTRYPSATFITPIHRGPQPLQLILPYSNTSTNIAGTAGSNTATERTNTPGEKVPRGQEASRSQNQSTDLDDD
jgi:hypothetical protein